jgi:hypothetical protein
MGAFYATVTTIGPPQDQVVAEVRSIRSFVGPTRDGVTVMYPDMAALYSDRNSDRVSPFWGQISKNLSSPVFIAAVADDDVFYYELWVKGELIDRYYFEHKPSGGNVRKLCAIFSCKNQDELATILSSEDRYVYQSQRHLDVVKAIGLPHMSVNMGYDYIKAGETPQGVGRDELTETPK